jgi:hypothetical protein
MTLSIAYNPIQMILTPLYKRKISQIMDKSKGKEKNDHLRTRFLFFLK